MKNHVLEQRTTKKEDIAEKGNKRPEGDCGRAREKVWGTRGTFLFCSRSQKSLSRSLLPFFFHLGQWERSYTGCRLLAAAPPEIDIFSLLSFLYSLWAVCMLERKVACALVFSFLFSCSFFFHHVCAYYFRRATDGLSWLLLFSLYTEARKRCHYLIVYSLSL